MREGKEEGDDTRHSLWRVSCLFCVFFFFFLLAAANGGEGGRERKGIVEEQNALLLSFGFFYCYCYCCVCVHGVLFLLFPLLFFFFLEAVLDAHMSCGSRSIGRSVGVVDARRVWLFILLYIYIYIYKWMLPPLCASLRQSLLSIYYKCARNCKLHRPPFTIHSKSARQTKTNAGMGLNTGFCWFHAGAPI